MRKRNRKFRINLKRLVLVLSIIVLILYICIKSSLTYFLNNITNGTGTSVTSTLVDEDKYKVIKEDVNENYGGKRTRKSIRQRPDILLLSQPLMII